MIIPMVCFTCGKPISHIYPKYLILIEKYKNLENKEFKALAELLIGTECCRRMLLTQHDMYKLVNETYLDSY